MCLNVFLKIASLWIWNSYNSFTSCKITKTILNVKICLKWVTRWQTKDHQIFVASKQQAKVAKETKMSRGDDFCPV